MPHALGGGTEDRFFLPVCPKQASLFSRETLSLPRLLDRQRSLVAQLVKNLPAVQETWVRSLGWEEPLEKGKATHSSYSGLENSMDCIDHGVAKSWTQLNNFTLKI